MTNAALLRDLNRSITRPDWFSATPIDPARMHCGPVVVRDSQRAMWARVFFRAVSTCPEQARVRARLQAVWKQSRKKLPAIRMVRKA